MDTNLIPMAASPSLFSLTAAHSGRYQDTPWSVAAVIHGVLIFGLAAWLGIPAVRADYASPTNDPTRPALDFHAVLFLRAFLAAATVAGVAAAGLLFVLRHFGGRAINVLRYASIGCLALMGAALLDSAPGAGAALLVAALLCAWFVWATQSRVPLAAAHLQAACDAVLHHRAVLVVAGLGGAAQLVWIVVWGAAALGVEHATNAAARSGIDPRSRNGDNYNGGGGGSGGVLVFLMLISLFWGAGILRGVVNFTVAAVTGHWWYSGSPPHDVVANSLKRALRQSLGSLSLAALAVAFLQTLSAMLRAARHRAWWNHWANYGGAGTAGWAHVGGQFGGYASAVLLSLASYVARVMAQTAEYFTAWAVVFCALTGAPLMVRGGAEWGGLCYWKWFRVVLIPLSFHVLSSPRKAARRRRRSLPSAASPRS